MTQQQPSDERYMKEEMIVVAMDLGTTNSAVSFSYLYPGTVPIVQMVSRWPGQPEASGDSKIPSLIAYREGCAVAYGAEAREYGADDEYEVAKWFKLHLHPECIKATDQPPAYGTDHLPQMEIPALPQGITLTRVYTDLMKYLFQGARSFFQDATPNGASIWQRLEDRIVIVLCTPNAWTVSQQHFLREVAVKADLVKEAEAESLVEFVTEGEASVHYALKYTNGDLWLDKNSMFVVIDAGGSTIDSTLYECKENKPRIVLEEVCGSECIQAGGIFVDRAIRDMLEDKLESSKFAEDEMLDLMTNEFERKTKRLFDGSQTSNVIGFGRSSDNDREHGIIKGKLSLSLSEVADAFDLSEHGIMDSCSKLLCGRKIKHLLLVGGFGESPYLRRSLDEKFSSQGTQIVIVPEPSKKAAAEGALIWYIRQLVVARAARFTLGIRFQRKFDAESPLHQQRLRRVKIGFDGRLKLDDFFEPLLQKDVVVQQDSQKSFTFGNFFTEFPKDLGHFKLTIASWEGQGLTPWFVDENGDQLPQMRNTCTLKADLSKLGPSLSLRTGINGHKYYAVPFDVVLELGRTQLQARLQWTEGQDQDLSRTCDDYPSLIVLELGMPTSPGFEKTERFLAYGNGSYNM